MRASTHLIILTGFLGAGLLTCQGASWGSIRGNNRSQSESRGEGFRAGTAQRGAQPTAPAPRQEFRTERPTEQHREARGSDVIGRGEREEHEEHRFLAPDWRENRHLDIDRDRAHSFFWFGYNPGMIINTLPPDYTQVYVGGNPYYYDQGVYYQPGPSGYVVVTPPIGVLVPQLPPGCVAIPVGALTYYYGAGAFYVQEPQGFRVVAPPLGITVPELPPGAVPVNVNGMTWYQANGVYFEPVIQNGVTVFMTAQP